MNTKLLTASLCLILSSGCTGFFDRVGALAPNAHNITSASKNSIPNNLSMQNNTEIEMKLLALMPNATLQMNGTTYDAFSYQANNYGALYGVLHGLGIASVQPNGPTVNEPMTTTTNLYGNYDTWYNGPLDLSAIPGFTIPKYFYPTKHFSTAFATKYGSILAGMNGNPTPITNIGFRSMTTDLCTGTNLTSSNLYNISRGWLNGSASTDQILMHIHAMASQAWLMPLATDAPELTTIRKAFDDLKAQAITDGLSGSAATDRAYMGACQIVLMSPQFWVGPSGKGQALIRSTIRLASRLPTQAEMRSYLTNADSFSNILTNLMSESSFKATVEGWHVDQLGLQMATGGPFGGQGFRSLNWTPGHGGALRQVTRSAYLDPDDNTATSSLWLASPRDGEYEMTTENLLHMSYWVDWFKNGNPFGQATSPKIAALATYLDTQLNNNAGKKSIKKQAFDNRTTGLWFKRFNTITNTMEFVGGFILDLGNSTDNGNELALQTGFTFSPSEVSTRCASWDYHPSRWLICKGSVTIDGSGTVQDVELSHIPLNIVTLGTGINYQGTWPTSGLGSDYANLPLYGQHLAERWSPSGKQDGFSKMVLPQSNDSIWVPNTFARYETSCVRKNTSQNPAPDPLVARAGEDPWDTGPGCSTESPSSSKSMAIAFGGPTGCSNAFYRFSYGYGDTALGLHMDPVALESFHCGAVNTGAITASTPSPITASVNANLWTDAKFDSVVPFGPYGINDRTPTAAPASSFIPIVWNLTLSSSHRYGFMDDTAGSYWASLESAMNTAPYLQYQWAQQKLIEGEAMMEPIRLLEAILDGRDGLGDYRNLITSPITYGSSFYQQYLASGGNGLPYYAPGYTPKSDLHRFDVVKIDRTNFQSIDTQVINANSFIGGRQSVYYPLPAHTGIMTMASFTRPVASNGGKMRTMAARILSRLISAPDAFVPTNQTLHKSYFLTTGPNDPHLQPSCIACHINLDPLVRALYPQSWETNPLLDQRGNEVSNSSWEVGGAGANLNTGHKGTGALFDQEVTGWEAVATKLADHELFALNTVTQAYNRLYHPAGFPSSEHNAMIIQVAKNFMAQGYNYRTMLLDLLTYKGYFEAAP